MRIRSSITGLRNLIAQRRLVDALVEPHSVAVVIVIFVALSDTSVFMLATSTETYLPMSDSATTASIACRR